jgi:hypothetical protein
VTIHFSSPHEDTRSFGRERIRGNNDIKMDHIEIGSDSANWAQAAVLNTGCSCSESERTVNKKATFKIIG